jgi:hypothetical protein
MNALQQFVFNIKQLLGDGLPRQNTINRCGFLFPPEQHMEPMNMPLDMRKMPL